MFENNLSEILVLLSCLTALGATIWALLLRRKMNAALLAINHHAIYSRTDAAGTITEVNDKFCSVSGYSKAELIGQNHRLLKSDYHEADFFELMWRKISRGQAWSGIIKNHNKQKMPYWVKSTIVPEYNFLNRICGYTAIRTELTDIKVRGDAALEVLGLLDAIEEELLIFDIDTFNVVYANSSATSAHGVKESEVLDSTIEAFGMRREDKALLDALKQLSEGETKSAEYTSVIDLDHGEKSARHLKHRLSLHTTSSGQSRVILISEDISEQVALQGKVQRLANLVNESKVPIFLADFGESKFIEFNQAMHDLYGYTKEEFAEISPGELRVDRQAPHVIERDLLKQAKSSENHIVSYEVAHRRKNGEEFMCHVHFSLINDENGRPLAFGTFEDVTEQHNTQRDLKRLLSAFDLIEDEIYLISRNDLKYAYMNASARKRLPGTETVFQDLTPADLFPDFDEADIHDAAELMDKGEQSTVVINKPVPGIEFGELTLQCIDLEDGEPLVLNQVRDISWRVAFEGEITKMRAAIEGSDDIICIADPHSFQIVYMNQAGNAKIEGDVAGVDARLMLSEFLPEFELSQIKKTASDLSHDDSMTRVIEATDKNGTPLEIKIQTVHDGKQPWLVAHIRDVTFRKELEAKKKKFISVVSHELRTPITSIKGALSVLATGAMEANPKAATELATIASVNADKLARLVNDIVDVEKMDSGNFQVLKEPTLISDVVKEAIEQNQPYAEQFGVRLVVTELAEDLYVLGDSLRLMQILDNLLSNAAKFSAGAPEVHLSCAEHDGKCEVIVRDFGDGIPEESQEFIFETFTQLGRSDTSKVRGSGLGLSIVKELVEKHDGKISVVSEVGTGTAFIVTIPMIEAPD